MVQCVLQFQGDATSQLQSEILKLILLIEETVLNHVEENGEYLMTKIMNLYMMARCS